MKHDNKLVNIKNHQNQKKIIELSIEKISTTNKSAIELINEGKLELGLQLLKEFENEIKTLLDFHTNESHSLQLNSKYLMPLLNNLAYCYQKLSDSDSTIKYLEAVIFHFKLELEYKYKGSDDLKGLSIKNIEEQIITYIFYVKLNLQLCAMLSRVERHNEALQISELCCSIAEETIFKLQYLIDLKLTNDTNNNCIMNKYFLGVVERLRMNSPTPVSSRIHNEKVNKFEKSKITEKFLQRSKIQSKKILLDCYLILYKIFI